MSHVFFAAKTTTGRGTVGNVSHTDLRKAWSPKIIEIKGTFTTGSAKVEVSFDGITFYDYGAAKTAVGIWEIASPFPYIHVNITVATTVSLTATMI